MRELHAEAFKTWHQSLQSNTEGRNGKSVSVCVREREKVKALLNPQNIMMIQEALREVNGGECVSEKVK